MLTTKYSQWQTVTFHCLYVTQHTLFQDLHCQEQSSALQWAPHHHESTSQGALVHQTHDKSGSQCVHQLLPHAAEDLWSLEPKLKEKLILEYYTHILHIIHMILIQSPLMCLKIPYTYPIIDDKNKTLFFCKTDPIVVRHNKIDICCGWQQQVCQF